MTEWFITKEEREKCRRVAEIFDGAFGEEEDLVVVDAGRFGYVKLQYFKMPRGFDSIFTYLDAETMFEDLWEDWYDSWLLEAAKGTPMMEMDYDEIFKCMPKEKQEELMRKKEEFRKAAGL